MKRLAISLLASLLLASVVAQPTFAVGIFVGFGARRSSPFVEQGATDEEALAMRPGYEYKSNDPCPTRCGAYDGVVQELFRDARRRVDVFSRAILAGNMHTPKNKPLLGKWLDYYMSILI